MSSPPTPRRWARQLAVQYCCMCDTNTCDPRNRDVPLEESRCEWRSLRNCGHCMMRDGWSVNELDDFLRGAYKDEKVAPPAPVIVFARGLVEKVLAARATIDQRLITLTKHWALPRVGTVERNILRVAIVELGELDLPIVITEAIAIANLFGGKDSGKFVNGILSAYDQEYPAAPQAVPAL